MVDISWGQAAVLVGVVFGLCAMCWGYGYIEGRESERNKGDHRA
jgi:hypothetical protein